MKSHVFQMKYFLAGIYIICVIFTCFNARFYHTPLAKISSVTEKETMSRKKRNQGCRRVLLYSENYSAYIKRYP